MKRPSKPLELSFKSRLERISTEAEYFALSVPMQITLALGTKGPVPVSAKVNDSEIFLVSLFPVGGGRHYIRVKAKIREQTKIKEGDQVNVHLTVRNHVDEILIPDDLKKVLESAGVLEYFKALPNGQVSFTLRRINDAAKPETREKRIQEAVEMAHEKRERQIDKRSK